jgi:hypothetical protein
MPVLIDSSFLELYEGFPATGAAGGRGQEIADRMMRAARRSR